MTSTPVHTPHDLYRCWKSLMGPLGFSRRSLWLAFLDPDGQLAPTLRNIDELPTRGSAETCRPLLEMCQHVLAGAGQDWSVAMVLTRPGRNPMNADDRSWAHGLVAAAAALGVAMHPVHFANDEELLVFAPDEELVTP